MESSEGFLPMSPFSFPPDPKPVSDSSRLESGSSSKFLEGVSHHQRCSSEGFPIEEQPSWLDDLLNEDTIFHRGHRRSVSDSYAYLGDESEFVNAYFGASTTSQHHNDNKGNNSMAQTIYQETDGVSSLPAENGTQESSTQNPEGSDKGVGSQVKNPGSKAESKRSKQHNTHRSRVRKLQYTSHLERTLEVLKAEGDEVSAALEFVEQQNIILTMENRALRQRLEGLTQEQLIKNWEQGMLEREIGRLQSLFHFQKQQQMQMHHHQQLHNQHSKHRRNRSRDLDHQVNNTTMKNKDALSTKDSVDGPIHV
ncbi:hypothetical protein ACS0TY_027997 [Phlomoides rotata]